MNDFQEEIHILFANDTACTFRIELYAEKLNIKWGDGSTFSCEEQKYGFIQHYFGGQGKQTIIIKGTHITYLNVSRLNLLQLNLIHCPYLKYLDCSINELEEIDLSACPQLKELYCNSNHIAQLSLEHLPFLHQIYAAYNQLEELDISVCPGLQVLHCSHNPLKRFRLDQNFFLRELNLGDNLLGKTRQDELLVHFLRMNKMILIYCR